MPRIVVTEGAAAGLRRCRRFLEGKNPVAARRAAQAIRQQLSLLASSPNLGKPTPGLPDLRELTIGFGDAGYIALYRYERARDAVIVLAFRHQKEAGY